MIINSKLRYVVIGLSIVLQIPFALAGNHGSRNSGSATATTDRTKVNASFKLLSEVPSQILEETLTPLVKSLENLKAISTITLDEEGNKVFTPNDSDSYQAWRTDTVKALLDPKTQFSEISAGIFLMGGTDQDAEERERPSWVNITKPYLMQRTFVTQLLYGLVMEQNRSYFQNKKTCPNEHFILNLNFNENPKTISFCPSHPATTISLYKIADRGRDGSYAEGTFLRKLKDEFGIVKRLPTEAEWEKAARGKATQEEMDDLKSPFYQVYYFGDAGRNNENISKHAWWKENSGEQTHPTGHDGWNSNNLSGMCGNVFSWTDTTFEKNYPLAASKETALVDPKGPAGHFGGMKVIRGGAWNTVSKIELRLAFRAGLFDFPLAYLGFRLADDLPAVAAQ